MKTDSPQSWRLQSEKSQPKVEHKIRLWQYALVSVRELKESVLAPPENERHEFVA